MLLDSHGAMKAIIRLGPKVPANLPAAEPEEKDPVNSTTTTANNDISSGSSPNPSRTVGVHGEEKAVGKQAPAKHAVGIIGERSGKRALCRSPGCVISKNQNERCTVVKREDTAGGTRSSREGGGKTTKPRFGEGNPCHGGEGRREEEDRGAGGDVSHRFSCSSGYAVREGEIEDASTRKLCSLPFYYFRFIANVARVPSGRAVVQSSGTLKRCLERLALDVSGSPAARLATFRCRSEICILIARMAGTYDRDTGTANDFILSPRYRAVRVVLGVLATHPEDGARLGGGGGGGEASKALVEVARYNAACALAELCGDVLKAVPLTADAGGIQLACKIINDPGSPMPLLKQVK